MALFCSSVPVSDDSEAPFTLVIFKCLADKTLLFTCSHIVCLLYPRNTNLMHASPFLSYMQIMVVHDPQRKVVIMLQKKCAY